MPQRIGFTAVITLLALAGAFEAAITLLTLATRPRLERILLKGWHR